MGGKVAFMFSLVPEKVISLPFRFDARGNIVTTTDLTKIWADRVTVALGTLKNERLFMPNYGSEVPLHTMDPIRTVEDLVFQDVADVFATYLPLLKLQDVVTTVNSNEGIINIEVFYELPTQENVITQIGFATLNGVGPATETPA